MLIYKRLLNIFVLCITFMVSSVVMGESLGDRFTYKSLLMEETSSLNIMVQSINSESGEVAFNGVDMGAVASSFTWDFGDGIIVQGWFPQKHVYGDTSKNYVVTVTSHYVGGSTDSVDTLVRFVSPQVDELFVPDYLAVTVPEVDTELVSRMPYPIPAQLTPMSSGCFDAVPCHVVEYVLSVAAAIQLDFAGNDVLFPDGSFSQIVKQDPRLQGSGMYSLWFTTPVSFAASCDAFSGSIAYSSFFHEMGHNLTLNFPRDYHFGGKTDGNANAIYSESMAQIFQHATAYEMLNRVETYGLSEDLAYDIAQSATASFMGIRQAFERYMERDPNTRYVSWNSPNTQHDETFDTFMTLAYKFIEHAELADQGFREPTQRLCQFLGYFNPQWHNRFSQYRNSPDAESFRASLMVAALSYAVEADLRDEFKALSFPIDDTDFDYLMEYVESRVPLPLTTIEELDALFKHWLEDRCHPLNDWCDGADRNGDSIVDFGDYAILARYWSESYEPFMDKDSR